MDKLKAPFGKLKAPFGKLKTPFGKLKTPFGKLRVSGSWIPLVVTLPALSTAEGSNHERPTWVHQRMLDPIHAVRLRDHRQQVIDADRRRIIAPAQGVGCRFLVQQRLQ